MEAVVVEAAVAVEAAAVETDPNKPLRQLTVQWHITNQCNKRCKHCYQETYQDGGSANDPARNSCRNPASETNPSPSQEFQPFSALQSIAGQIFSLHRQEQQRAGASLPLHLTLTGGEPCMHPELFELLALLRQHPAKPRLSLLSNGSLIDKPLALHCARMHLAFVQLSVEGTPATHDNIRGAGSFAETLAASQALHKAGVRVIWSFTAHTGNYTEFAEVVRIAKKYKVNRVWSDRMIPPCQGADQTWGHGQEQAPNQGHPSQEQGHTLEALNRVQTQEYLHTLGKTQKQAIQNRTAATEIFLGRALQFQAGGGVPYHCKAGHELLAIMPNGDVYPCRRLPVLAGNVLQTSLPEIYATHLMQSLRAFTCPAACQPCAYKDLCKGGLRCLSHSLTGDMFAQDPGCGALKKY